MDAFTSAILVFPLFATYQIGILSGARGHNGADFISGALFEVSQRSATTYLQLLAAAILGYLILLFALRRSGHFQARSFVPMLLESFVYAFFMGGIIHAVMERFAGVLPILAIADADALDVVVISAGAGLHEELVFRAIMMGGLLRFFRLPLGPFGGTSAAIVALLVSALAFAAIHHVGPAGEPFTGFAFVFRSLAGILFGLIYWLRGFAVAAWTHCLYDVLVIGFGD